MTAPVKPKRPRRASSRVLLDGRNRTRQPRGFRSPENDECRLLTGEEALASSVLKLAYQDLKAGRLGMRDWWESEHVEVWAEAINVPVEQVCRRALRAVPV